MTLQEQSEDLIKAINAALDEADRLKARGEELNRLNHALSARHSDLDTLEKRLKEEKLRIAMQTAFNDQLRLELEQKELILNKRGKNNTETEQHLTEWEERLNKRESKYRDLDAVVQNIKDREAVIASEIEADRHRKEMIAKKEAAIDKEKERLIKFA